jgi:hypothetical protein
MEKESRNRRKAESETSHLMLHFKNLSSGVSHRTHKVLYQHKALRWGVVGEQRAQGVEAPGLHQLSNSCARGGKLYACSNKRMRVKIGRGGVGECGSALSKKGVQPSSTWPNVCKITFRPDVCTITFTQPGVHLLSCYWGGCWPMTASNSLV